VNLRMKPVIIIIIAVGVGISASVILFLLNSDLGVMKTACDIHKDQVFEEIPLGTDDYFRLDQEFQVLTDEALEKRNWYIANCLE